ncbi:hypothetical protein L9F63_020128 [Diploptera punctata]|uniref:BAR domain-containing protein n=1 Tax=Diploptera punctata TaxID=6984 RepID=A0AAD7ZSU3_DIPPU|nr:hypothetical protein L9F63_020128 [Diploptera punctata]
MTWNPLKRNYLTTRPSPAPHVLTKQDERNLEIIFHKLQCIEEASRKLHKDAKKYLENAAVVAKLEQTKLHSDYHSVTSQVSASVRELSLINQRTFQEPLKKFGNTFMNLDPAFQHREQLVQDWRNLSAKVRKLEERERTANNIVKLEREKKALQVTAKELETYHVFILSEMIQFYEKSIDYFGPSFQALLRSQLEYYGNNTRLFTHLVPTSEGSPSLNYSDPEYEAKIIGKLDSIRALSIVRTR